MSRKLALIIGNSEYQDATLATLTSPASDVNTLSLVLRNPEIGGFDKVIPLINETAPVIRRAVARLFHQRAPDDLLLLYFSGHGVRDDSGRLYLAVTDTEHDLLSATAIEAAFVTSEMDRSRSRRQVLILDCCHSGAFAQGAKGAPGASVGTAATFEGSGYGRVVLTASDATQYAWEGNQVIGEAENSLFSHYLIEGLSTGKADGDADGHITIDELYDYAHKGVVTASARQTPGKWSYKQQGTVIIASNPAPVLQPAELPQELRQSVEDRLPWVREGAVGELKRLLLGADKSLALAAREALEQLRDNDDSRRVAALARNILAEYARKQPKPGGDAPAEGERQLLHHQGLHFGPRKAGSVLDELLGLTRSLALTNRRIMLTRVGVRDGLRRSATDKMSLEIPLQQVESVEATLRGFSITLWLWFPFSLVAWLATRRLKITYRDDRGLQSVLFHVPQVHKWMTEINDTLARGQQSV